MKCQFWQVEPENEYVLFPPKLRPIVLQLFVTHLVTSCRLRYLGMIEFY